MEISGVILLGVYQSHIYLDVKTVDCYVKISYLSCFLQCDSYPYPVDWMGKCM